MRPQERHEPADGGHRDAERQPEDHRLAPRHRAFPGAAVDDVHTEVEQPAQDEKCGTAVGEALVRRGRGEAAGAEDSEHELSHGLPDLPTPRR